MDSELIYKFDLSNKFNDDQYNNSILLTVAKTLDINLTEVIVLILEGTDGSLRKLGMIQGTSKMCPVVIAKVELTDSLS